MVASASALVGAACKAVRSYSASDTARRIADSAAAASPEALTSVKDPDRITRDALYVRAAEQRRLLGRDAPPFELGRELAKKHGWQSRSAFPDSPPCVGHDEPVTSSFAGKREDERLFAAAVSSSPQRQPRSLGDLGPLLVEEDRVLPDRRGKRPLGRPEDPNARELNPCERVDGQDVDPPSGKRAGVAVDDVFGSQRGESTPHDVQEPCAIDFRLQGCKALQSPQRSRDLSAAVDVTAK